MLTTALTILCLLTQLSMAERSKFEEETLVNVAGRTKNGGGVSSRWAGQPGENELIVVTILVAAETAMKLPPIRSQEELKIALTKLGSLRSDQVCQLLPLLPPTLLPPCLPIPLLCLAAQPTHLHLG